MENDKWNSYSAKEDSAPLLSFLISQAKKESYDEPHSDSEKIEIEGTE